MSTSKNPLDRARLDYAKRVIEKYGHLIDPEVQRDILAQHVSIGMPP